MLNRQVRLKSRPTGIPQANHFEIVESALPDMADRQFLVRNTYLSVEPAMRGWVEATANYSTPVEANGGVVVTTSTATIVHRERIITLAARHRLPAVYPYRLFVTSGGLISYGADSVDSYRRAAGYVDRILKGEKPAALPVQAPTIPLGLEVPPALLARADEVIE
jgi:hypothetical protein